MKPIRVLGLSTLPEEGASARFRIFQFAPALRENGIELAVEPFYSPEFFRILYREGELFQKGAMFLKQLRARWHLMKRRHEYDLFLVHREALPVGPPVIERMLAKEVKKPLVFDFDDAIYLPNVSDANRFWGSMKWPRKVAEIIRGSCQVIAGNDYLAQYADQFNKSVTVIPTCVDTDRFVPTGRRHPGLSVPVLGWIGSPTTLPYLLDIRHSLCRIAASGRFVLRVAGTGRRVEIPNVTVANEPWSIEREVSLFNTCDVGLYPLRDDPWTRGKCGFKAIQFMACGVPVIASAVGVNRTIIQDGINGFLARSASEWEEKIGWLLADPALREKLGKAGRQTVVERYSLSSQAPVLTSVLHAALAHA